MGNEERRIWRMARNKTADVPIHHQTLQLLNIYREIIASNGVVLDENPWSFTPEEDEQIRENWQNIAEENGIEQSILDYFRYDSTTTKFQKYNWRESRKYAGIWPALCENLPNRSAATVRKRIALIFDENSGNRQRAIDLQAESMLKRGASAREVAATLKIPLESIATRQSPVRDEPKFTRRQRKMIDENGFDINPWTFTPEEDDQIRENWSNIVVRSGVETSIFEYIGYDHYDGRFLEAHDDLTPFCESLPNRNIDTVQERIAYIFHPNYDPDERYDIERMKEMLENGLPTRDVGNELKIPLEFVAAARKRRKARLKMQRHRRKSKPLDLSKGNLISLLRVLEESLLDGADQLKTKSVDWETFEQKCFEAEIDPVPQKTEVLHRIGLLLRKAELLVFVHLKAEKPTLSAKLVFILEALLLYEADNNRKQGDTVPKMYEKNLLSVVFEHYNRRETAWQPPEDLARKYAEKVSTARIESRLKAVKDESKKRRSHSESPTVLIRTKRLGSAEQAELRRKRLKMNVRFDTRLEESDVFEISSIHADSSALNLSQDSENVSDLTNLEISDYSSICANETILAGGGVDRRRRNEKEDDDDDDENQNLQTALSETKFASLLVPDINESLRKEKEETEKKCSSFLPDQSNDVWSQLVNF